MEDKIQELRRIIQDKENTIQSLEKSKPNLSHDNVYFKYREVRTIINKNNLLLLLLLLILFLLLFSSMMIIIIIIISDYYYY